jgi:hypothetical protein
MFKFKFAIKLEFSRLELKVGVKAKDGRLETGVLKGDKRPDGKGPTDNLEKEIKKKK